MEYVHIFVYIAILLLAALLSTRLMKVLKLPNVTGYILTGIIMGPFVFGLLFNNFTYDGIRESIIYGFVDKIKWVSTIALGFIAFSIGTSFKISTIKAVGKKVIIIGYDGVDNNINISVRVDYDIIYDSEIKYLDTSSCVLLSKIKDEDKEKIYKKFMKQEGMISFIKSVTGEEDNTV